jgi:anti-anti-sigma factor
LRYGLLAFERKIQEDRAKNLMVELKVELLMAICSSISGDGKTLMIEVDGRFDASLLDEFRNCYESGSRNLTSYEVNLRKAEYLDSSALGMLLVLRDYAGGDKAEIKISNCSPEVKKIFAISSFEKLFSIQ